MKLLIQTDIPLIPEEEWSCPRPDYLWARDGRVLAQKVNLHEEEHMVFCLHWLNDNAVNFSFRALSMYVEDCLVMEWVGPAPHPAE